MISFEKITTPLFPKLYSSFLVDDDPLSTEQDWRNVFDYAWDTGEGYCGYAMLDDGEVVGMLGMIFSERLIEGAPRRFCNLHTYWVREDHRGRSLFLLRPLLRLDGYTVTHFTPCDTVRAVTKKLGFESLNNQLRILLPLGGGSNGGSPFSWEPGVIADRVADPDRRILQDHQPYGCGHLLICEEDRYCYILYTEVKRHRVPYVHIHYISDLELFGRREREVRRALFKRHSIRFVALDDRLVGDLRLRLSFRFWAPAHALFKSSEVRSEQIDNLYSDVVFLKLTTLPDISHEIGALAGQLFSRRGRSAS